MTGERLLKGYDMEKSAAIHGHRGKALSPMRFKGACARSARRGRALCAAVLAYAMVPGAPAAPAEEKTNAVAGGSRASGAPKGQLEKLAPDRKLRMGVLSDVHISTSNTELWKWKKALEHFRDVKVDVVVVAGDLINEGLISELETFAKTWHEIFPGGRRPDGEKVEHVFCMGNHDVSRGQKRRFVTKGADGEEVYDEAAHDKVLVCCHRERLWKELFNEEYSHFYAKNVKGYWFLVSNWRSTSPKHVYEAVELPGYLEEHADELGKTRPFFFVQHPHPKGTCHWRDAWWPDSGRNTTDVLTNFPNAVCFSGHSHRPLTDERAVWQGGFTSFGTGSLSYGSPLGDDPEVDIRAGASAPEGHPYRITNGDCHTGYVIDVHDGFLVVRRMEFKYLKPLGPDWVVPVPVGPDPAFAFDKRKGARKPPAYAKPPAVGFRNVTLKRWNGTPYEMQQVAFEAVPQTDKACSRVYGYEITMRPKDGSPAMIRNIKSAAADMPPEMEPEMVLWHVKPETFTKPDDYDISIVPFDCFRVRAERRRKCFAFFGARLGRQPGNGDADVFYREGAQLDNLVGEVLRTRKRHDAYVLFAGAPDDKAAQQDLTKAKSRIGSWYPDAAVIIAADAEEALKQLAALGK